MRSSRPRGAWISPHRPHDGTSRHLDLLGDGEPVAGVERNVALFGGLQIHALAFAITAVQDGAENGRPESTTLRIGLGPEHLEIPVALLGMMTGEVHEPLGTPGDPAS